MGLKNRLQTTRAHLSFYGWRMVLVGCLFRWLGGGFHFYGFTVFFLPLSADLNINRARTSLVFSLARAEGALEGPLAGYLIDRFGPRPVMMVAVLLTGLGYALLFWIDTYVNFLIVYMGVISLAFGAGFMHGPMVLANSWFSRWRARAMALVSCSIGVGGALLAPILALVVHYYGWRWGVMFAGAGFLLLGTPLAAMVRRSPESMGLLPDGESPTPRSHEDDSRSTAHSTTNGTDVGIWEAMRGAPFWLIVTATLFRVLGLTTIIVHFVPILVWKGMEELTASWLLSIFAGLSLPTHLVVASLADHYNKARIMAACMVVSAAGLVVLIYAQSTPWLILSLPLLVVVEAVFPVTWAMVGDFYGRQHFAKVRGNMGFVYQWGGFFGPVVAGAIFDATRDYELSLWGIVLLYLVAAWIYLMLSKPWMERMRALQASQ